MVDRRTLLIYALPILQNIGWFNRLCLYYTPADYEKLMLLEDNLYISSKLRSVYPVAE